MNEGANKGSKRMTWIFYAGLVLFVLGPIGARIGVPPFAAMLSVTFGSLFFLIAGGMVIWGLFSKGVANTPTLGWVCLVFAAVTLLNTYSRFSTGAPPIHDISTDTVNPPEFVDIIPLRADAPNPPAYLDNGTAEKQAEAFPDIKTIVLPSDYAAVFEAAFVAAQDMGWEIVSSDEEAGRIEATATTPFTGFKDDVVIRITAADGNTLVDVRSKSRIGMGDMGVNAARVRSYTSKLTGISN